MDFVTGLESALGKESVGLLLQVVPDADTELDPTAAGCRAARSMA